MNFSSPTWAAIAAVAMGCLSSHAAAGAPQTPVPTPPAGTASAVIHGIDPADMNPTVSACKDFNEYGNGGWLKANQIPADQSYWGSFTILEETNRANLRKVLEKAAAGTSTSGSDERKVGDFWASCMDEAAIEAAGLNPVKPELTRIDKIGSAAELPAAIARLQSYGVNAGFLFTAEQDRRKSTEVIAYAGQGGLGLPDRDYYLKADDESKTMREQYLAHVQKMFALMGEDEKRASADAKTVMDFETRLAQASMTRVERRDPDATYNRKTAGELSKLTPNFSWSAYFRAVGTAPAAVNVAQPKFFEAFDKELRSTPLDQWKTYLRWHYVHAIAPELSKAFVEENFDFYGKTLTGTPENEPRWKRCVSAADGELGFALGKAYVKDFFPPEAKARADAMVQNLIAALREDLKTIPWMGDATKQQALKKLSTFNPKIGYPEKWRDYAGLEIDRGPYVLNTQRADEFEFRRQLAKVGKPVDRQDWQMTPPEVNAYYDPQLNEIVFPAGILQPPFFDAQADDAVNYGAMGAVIGHEMTHGFDDEGRKFDAEGNLRDWWTAQDAKNYDERSKCVERQYDSYEFDGQHVNGKLVLGEATADLGGLGIAYKAYKKALEGKGEPAKIDGLTGDQRFFLAWARGWAANIRPELSKLMMNTNPHPLSQFRAIGPPSTLPAFAKAFGCAPGDPMVRKDLCQIW
ncbi:MAG: M13 family metallopeptidase [Acidobacteriota bacterium]